MSAFGGAFAGAQRIADAILYEGYALYPYRASAMKNQLRWTFGTLAPEGGMEPSALRCQCLLEAPEDAVIEVRARFLHMIARTLSVIEAGERRAAASIDIGGERVDAWEEGVPREVDTGPLRVRDLVEAPHRRCFTYEGSLEEREIQGEEGVARVRREQRRIDGELTISAEALGDGVVRLTVRLSNVTAEGPDGGNRSLASAHVLLAVSGGAFVSLLDPPERLRAHADACSNDGAWPVLAGEPGARDVVLCSPIILYDHPAVAPESPGDLFDGTEMDEMLALRILTLTDDEKREAAACDERVRALLARTHGLGPDALARLHGAIRSLGPAAPPRRVSAGGALVGPGDRVRLRPRGRSDVLDLALAGEIATITSIEEDYESTVFVTVTVDADPGRDLGASGKPGHRFFFRTDEIEPIGIEAAIEPLAEGSP